MDWYSPEDEIHAHFHTPQALVLLQLHANLDVLLVASWRELSQYVCAFTKALAQLPSKYVPLQALSVDRAGLEGRTDSVLKVCLGVFVSGGSGTPRPFLSVQQGIGPQASK